MFRPKDELLVIVLLGTWAEEFAQRSGKGEVMTVWESALFRAFVNWDLPEDIVQNLEVQFGTPQKMAEALEELAARTSDGTRLAELRARSGVQ